MPAGKQLIRKTLRTRDRRTALKLARWYSILMDKLAKRFFDTPESYGKAQELLMKYIDVSELGWDKAEEFLMKLDPYEEYLLDTVIEYKEFYELQLKNKLFSNQYLSTNKAIDKNISYISSNNTPHLVEGFSEILLSNLLETFITEKRINWSKKAAESNEHKDYRPKIGLFVEIIGDKTAGKLNVSDIVHYKTALLKFPANRRKKRKYKNKSISELLVVVKPIRTLC